MKVVAQRAIYALILGAAAVLPSDSSADVCVYKPPHVARVCGIVVGPDGGPIPNVGVTVSKDGVTVKEATTGDTGDFDFDQIASGKYELDVSAVGYEHAGYQFTLTKPINSCKRALRIDMVLPSIHCGGNIRETNTPLAGRH